MIYNKLEWLYQTNVYISLYINYFPFTSQKYSMPRKRQRHTLKVLRSVFLRRLYIFYLNLSQRLKKTIIELDQFVKFSFPILRITEFLIINKSCIYKVRLPSF